MADGDEKEGDEASEEEDDESGSTVNNDENEEDDELTSNDDEKKEPGGMPSYLITVTKGVQNVDMMRVREDEQETGVGGDSKDEGGDAADFTDAAKAALLERNEDGEELGNILEPDDDETIAQS